MPATINHVYTSPVADGTATSVIRPSDWNSSHAFTLAPSGAEIIGAFSNSPSVTFGTNASGYVTASAVGGGGGGVALSAGTNSTSTGTVVFADSNGLTFGMNTNGVVTGSYTVPNVPAQTEYQFSNSNGVTFGTAGSTVTASVVTDYVAGSNSSLFQQVSNTSAITSNAMNTSERGNYVNTSQSSLFQQVSNTSAITANAMNTSERGNYFYTSNNTFANSTHTHGNIAFSGTNVSATFTTASNGLSIQLSAPTVGGAQTGISGLIAGTNTITSGTASFANANGVSFTGNGQNISASVRTDYAGTQFSGTNISGTINTNGISLSVNPGGAGGDGYNIIGVNGVTNTSLSATLVLSNANNVTFGLNASTITASASYPAQTVQPVAYSAANGSANFSTLTFANSNGVSFSTGTQGLYATVKTDYQSSNANYLTSQSNQAVSAGNGSFTFQTVTLADSNGVSFSTGTQGLYATVKTDYASSNHSHGNPTLALTNLAGTTASASNGLTLSLSATAQSVQPVAYSAANGSANFSTLTFANSNGVSFSTGTQGLYATVKTDYQSSNANYLTSQSNQAVSAANGSFTFQTVTFANSNGISFSTGTQGLYASHNGITQQSTQPVAYSAANGSAAFSTITFANSNGVSFSTGTQGLYASHNGLTSQSAQTANFYVSGNTTQLSSTAGLDLRSVSFEGAGIASVGVSNGRVLVSVPAGGGAGDGVNIVQAGTTGTTGTAWSSLSATVQVNGSGGILVSQNNSNQLVISNARWDNVAMTNLNFTTATNGVSINNVDDHLYAWELEGVNTAGTTGSTLTTKGAIFLSGGPNVTLSGNSNTIVISAPNPGGGGAATRQFYDNLGPLATASGALGGKAVQYRTLWFAPFEPFNGLFDGDMTANTIALDLSISGSTATLSGALSTTAYVGIYTVNSTAGTLSLGLINSVAITFGHAAAATNNSTAWQGQRFFSAHSSQWSSQPVFRDGSRYIMGVVLDSGGASSAQTGSVLGGYMHSTAARSGFVGNNIAAATWQGFGQIMGHYSATTNAMPAQVNYTQINKQVASANFIPHVIMYNYSNVTW